MLVGDHVQLLMRQLANWNWKVIDKIVEVVEIHSLSINYLALVKYRLSVTTTTLSLLVCDVTFLFQIGYNFFRNENQKQDS